MVAITTLVLAGFPAKRASAHCQKFSRPPQTPLPVQLRCFLDHLMVPTSHSLLISQVHNFRRLDRRRRTGRLYRFQYQYLSRLRLPVVLLARLAALPVHLAYPSYQAPRNPVCVSFSATAESSCPSGNLIWVAEAHSVRTSDPREVAWVYVIC